MSHGRHLHLSYRANLASSRGVGPVIGGTRLCSPTPPHVCSLLEPDIRHPTSIITQRSFGREVNVGCYDILTKRLVVEPAMRVPLGQHCDGLCWLESKVGLQLVKLTEHLCVCASKGGAAAVGALCLLQDREQGTVYRKALPSAPCF